MPHVVQQLRPVRHPVEAAPGETLLNVALYPYVPRPLGVLCIPMWA